MIYSRDCDYFLLLETRESDGRFEQINADIAVILNIDGDHVHFH